MPIYNAPILSVDPMETRRYAGLQKADFDQELIDNACMEARLLIKPRGIWNIYDYDASAQMVLPGGIVLQGQSIGRHLHNSCKIAVLCATIGEDIENQVTRSFAEGRYSFSVLLDAAATTAIEEVADGMEKSILSAANRQGLSMTWRFSPGYGDWPIEQQPEVLWLSHGDKIGVSLTEALMLTPRKSVTAVIGLFHQDKSCTASASRHNCSICSRQNCPARKI